MIIRVEVINELLGNSVFWEGDSSKISEIRNIPAKMLAEKVVKDGKKRTSGMWHVSASDFSW